MLNYSPTPTIELQSEFLRSAGVKVIVKREDLNHPTVSGNKWWKLKYNLEEVRKRKISTVLTFGGAYSNHIFATAAAAFELGVKSIGVVRGEEPRPLNSTLSFAKKHGMELHYITRESYRKKTDASFLQELHDRFGDFYLIPEGGTNELAIKGCREFASGHLSKIEFDSICLPVGTGGTLAGIALGLRPDKNLIGVSVLKDGNFLVDDVKKWLAPFSQQLMPSWKILTGYDHGGYAKTSPQLESFIAEMKNNFNLPLDHVYTGKLLFAVFEEIKKGNFQKGSTVLVLHTGGLQGSSH